MPGLARDPQTGDGIQALPFSAVLQTRATASSSAQTSAFASTTTIIRLVATKACYYEIGDNPTVSATTGHYLPANVIEYIRVEGGQKLAAIRDTEDGSLKIGEIALGS